MTPLLTLEWFYVAIGTILGAVAVRIARDTTRPRRWGAVAFWGMLSAVFVLGDKLPPAVVGYLVLAMVVLAAAKQVPALAGKLPPREERVREAERLKNRLFWPALLVPAVAVAGSLVLAKMHVGALVLAEPKQVTLIALGCGALLAMVAARRVTGASFVAPVAEGSRLLESIGWALILPQMLAALGGIFAKAGVGVVVAGIVTQVLPVQWPFVAVAAYCVGMAAFTMCLGNAFAAFAAITGGIGLPLIVRQHGGDPAIMAAIGMLSGYCGTLMTPMAANFNLVPALLLELPDKNAVVKTQVPVGLALLATNIALMWFCVYRF